MNDFLKPTTMRAYKYFPGNNPAIRFPVERVRPLPEEMEEATRIYEDAIQATVAFERANQDEPGKALAAHIYMTSGNVKYANDSAEAFMTHATPIARKQMVRDITTRVVKTFDAIKRFDYTDIDRTDRLADDNLISEIIMGDIGTDDRVFRRTLMYAVRRVYDTIAARRDVEAAERANGQDPIVYHMRYLGLTPDDIATMDEVIDGLSANIHYEAEENQNQ